MRKATLLLIPFFVSLAGCSTVAGIQKDIQASAKSAEEAEVKTIATPIIPPVTTRRTISNVESSPTPTIAPTPVQPPTFNALVKDGTNCRKGAGKSFEVVQVFQLGRVALNKTAIAADGENWYLERFQGCYVAGSLVRWDLAP